jgi:hypothetical protein
VRRSWRLNGRHYGALQGLDKAQVRQEHGEHQFMLWRRSYQATPPPLDPGTLAEVHQVAWSVVSWSCGATASCGPVPDLCLPGNGSSSAAPMVYSDRRRP